MRRFLCLHWTGDISPKSERQLETGMQWGRGDLAYARAWRWEGWGKSEGLGIPWPEPHTSLGAPWQQEATKDIRKGRVMAYQDDRYRLVLGSCPKAVEVSWVESDKASR